MGGSKFGSIIVCLCCRDSEIGRYVPNVDFLFRQRGEIGDFTVLRQGVLITDTCLVLVWVGGVIFLSEEQ